MNAEWIDSRAPDRPPSRAEWWILTGVLLVALLLRLPGLTEMPLWHDERFTLNIALLELKSILRLDRTHHPPGYPFLAHPLLRIGLPDWTVRVPAVLGGLGCVAILFLGLIAIGFRQVAPYSALAFACSLYHVYYSQEARAYSWMTALTGLSLFSASMYVMRPSARRLALVSSSCGLACWMHYLAIPSCAAILTVLAFVAILRREISGPLALIWAGLVVAIALSVWALWPRLGTLREVELHSAVTWIDVGPALVSNVAGRWSGLGADAGIPVAAMAIVGWIVFLRRSRALGILWLVATAAPFVLFGLIPWPRQFESRYLMAAAVPLHALACVGLWKTILFACAGIRRTPFVQLVPPFVFLILCWTMLDPTMTHARAPRKYQPALNNATPFSRRYLQLHSLLDTWMVRKNDEMEFPTTRRNIGPFSCLVPDWQPTRAFGEYSYAWQNPRAPEKLMVELEPPREQPLEESSPSSRRHKCRAIVRVWPDFLAPEQGGEFFVKLYCQDSDIRIKFRLISPRLDLAERYLKKAATSVRCPYGPDEITEDG